MKTNRATTKIEVAGDGSLESPAMLMQQTIREGRHPAGLSLGWALTLALVPACSDTVTSLEIEGTSSQSGEHGTAEATTVSDTVQTTSGTSSDSSSDTGESGPCIPDCSSISCGLDPRCGQPCGKCEVGLDCVAGECTCIPDCAELECGLEPRCGTECGPCDEGKHCQAGSCIEANCPDDHQCSTVECGLDPVCGIACGQCRFGDLCIEGSCVCESSCEDRECGPDPTCRGECGTSNCPDEQTCSGGTCIDRGECPPGAVWIAGGRFVPGQADDDTEVEVEGYCLDVNEVTVGQYRVCVEAGVCRIPSRNIWESGPTYYYIAGYRHRPVNGIRAIDGDSYCAFMGGDLPTGVQWEWAARGRDLGYTYPWGNEWEPSCELAIVDDGCGTGEAWPGGSRAKGGSRDGVQDMLGNMYEWTSAADGPTSGWRWARGIALDITRSGMWNDDEPSLDFGIRCAYPEGAGR